MAFDNPRATPDRPPTEPGAPRRAPRQPVDFFGRPASHPSARLGSDLVEEWKQQALGLLRERTNELALALSIRVRSSIGFILVGALAGVSWGVVGTLVSLTGLLAARLLQQLPAALWLRLEGNSVLVSVAALGDDVEPTARGFKRWLGVALGSLVNLVAALGIWLAFAPRPQIGSLPQVAEIFAFTHGGWALGQLLPLLPFQTGRALAQRWAPAQKLAFAALSFVLLAGSGVVLVRHGLSALLPLQVVAAVGAAGAGYNAVLKLREQAHDLDALIDCAEAELLRDDPGRALQIAQTALAVAELEASRTRLRRLIAWAAIGKRDPFLAHAVMQQLPGNCLSVDLVAAYLAACNRNEEALQLLRDARTLGHRERETSKLQIELLAKLGAHDDAAEIAAEDRRLLTSSDLRALERAGISWHSAARPASRSSL